MGLFDTIKENTNLVRGESSQSAGKFDQQIEAVEGQIREALIQIGTVYLEKHREDCEPDVSYRITCNNGNQRTLINP